MTDDTIREGDIIRVIHGRPPGLTGRVRYWTGHGMLAVIDNRGVTHQVDPRLVEVVRRAAR